MLFSLERAFTCAILTVQWAHCEQCSSAILRQRGDIILPSRVLADPGGRVPHWTGLAVARLCAAAPARRSGILHPACGRALPVQRHGAGPRRSEEHTSELQSHHDLVCRLLLEKKKKQ